MISKVKDLLSKKSPHHRKIYAIREGTHKGEFFVYVSEDNENYNFLVIPEIDVAHVVKSEFEQGIKEKIVDLVEKLPDNVYQLCCAQYNEAKSKNNINRLKQSFTQSSMDS